MSHCSRVTALVALSIVGCGVAASADTLRCQSVNGNLNCAGSNGVSCQTVNGKRVCVSGHGDVVQSFGGGASSDPSDEGAGADDGDLGGALAVPKVKQRLEQYDPNGRTLLLERDGVKLHLRTEWLSIDRE